ncbi:MAG: helix-turn-helix domain-containing protein, partial [Candidatus Nitrosopolaris sp.]
GAKEVHILTLKNHTNHPVDINRSSGLTGAIYILKCLSDGQSIKDIAQKFDNNEQMVSTWIGFLKYNRFIEEKEDSEENSIKLTISGIGRTWMRRYEFALR